MRMQIFIRDDLIEVLKAMAWDENRWPKQQAEWLLQKVLEQARDAKTSGDSVREDQDIERQVDAK